jgi:ketosteroid isomerase-like protein
MLGLVAAVLVLGGGSLAYQWFRLSATERRLVGVWIDDPAEGLGIHNSVMTFHAGGRYREEFGWIEKERAGLRWKWQMGYVHGTWSCEGDRLILHHFSKGAALDAWETVAAWWNGSPRFIQSAPETIVLRFDTHGHITFLSRSRQITSSSSGSDGHSTTTVSYPVWRKLADSSTKLVIAGPSPEEQRAFDDAMDERNRTRMGSLFE